jgi:hypothetical protein
VCVLYILYIDLITTGSHCHALQLKTGVDKRARRKLIIASTLCVFFMAGEVVGMR